jgi:NAD(P)-dependent dehydrogenase (short-subunit alcohol dehydrogenase family)
VAIPCDHTDDESVTLVFDRIAREHGRIDVLVNNAWGGYERMVEYGRFTWADPFWNQPVWRWDAMITAGVRAAFVASQHAARLMVSARRGLIVNISHWAAQKHIRNVLMGSPKRRPTR